MRSYKSLLALLLAAVLGTVLTACQREEIPSPKSEPGLPLPQGERIGAPPGPGASDKKLLQPGAGEGVDPHHPWRRPAGLIET